MGGQRLHCPLSKKFLWEELELVQEEVTFIYQKLRECPKPMTRRAGGPSAALAHLSPLPLQRRRKRRLRRTW